MAQLRTTTGGGAGPQINLANSENLVVIDGVQVYSDDDSVIEGAGRNDVILAANVGIFTFTDSVFEPAILLGTGWATAGPVRAPGLPAHRPQKNYQELRMLVGSRAIACQSRSLCTIATKVNGTSFSKGDVPRA